MDVKDACFFLDMCEAVMAGSSWLIIESEFAYQEDGCSYSNEVTVCEVGDNYIANK